MDWWIFVVLLSSVGCLALDDWDQFELVWQDEFDFLDLNKWQHEITAWGGGNSEFQVYTQDSKNSYVLDGKLYIKPSLLIDNINPSTGEAYGQDFMQYGVLDLIELYGGCTNSENGGCYRTGASQNIPPIMSGRLRSFERFSFTFGRVVVSAKMPVGDWMWPAIWMLPEDWVYGGWPVSGEIDIIESIGNRNFYTSGGDMLGIQRMGSTLHWGPSWDQNRYWLTAMHKTDTGNNYGDGFHTFILDWSPNGLRFFVDDENNALLDVPYPLIDQNPDWVDFWTWGQPWNPGTSNPWTSGSNLAPFDEAFHFVLNVAVGGTNGFIPDNGINWNGEPEFQKPWSNGDWYTDAMLKFYNSRTNWRWTWENESDNAAMQIDYIRVYQKI
jgi:beta-glucanase (GH16 family)